MSEKLKARFLRSSGVRGSKPCILHVVKYLCHPSCRWSQCYGTWHMSTVWSSQMFLLNCWKCDELKRCNKCLYSGYASSIGENDAAIIAHSTPFNSCSDPAQRNKHLLTKKLLIVLIFGLYLVQLSLDKLKFLHQTHINANSSIVHSSLVFYLTQVSNEVKTFAKFAIGS